MRSMAGRGWSNAAVPMSYAGDPTIRGLADMPTLFTASDVAQGAAQDTNISAMFSTASRSLFQSSITPSTSGAAPVQRPNVSAFDTSPTPKESTPTVTDPTNGGDVHQPTTNTSDDTSCDNVSFLSHPVIAMECVLGRALFGILALLLVGVGLYVFVKD